MSECAALSNSASFFFGSHARKKTFNFFLLKLNACAWRVRVVVSELRKESLARHEEDDVDGNDDEDQHRTASSGCVCVCVRGTA